MGRTNEAERTRWHFINEDDIIISPDGPQGKARGDVYAQLGVCHCAPRCAGERGRAGSSVAFRSPPQPHTVYETNAVTPGETERPNFLGLLNNSWFRRRPYDRLRIGDLVFKCADRFTEAG